MLTSEVMETIGDTLKCPKCGLPMQADHIIAKYRCSGCDAIFSITEQGTWLEWKEFEMIMTNFTPMHVIITYELGE